MLAFVVILVPSVTGLPAWQRVLLSMVALLTPLLYWLAVYAAVGLVAASRRSRGYAPLRQRWVEQQSDLLRTREALAELRVRRFGTLNAFPLQHCYALLGEAHVIIARKQGARLSVGADVVIVADEGVVYGRFRVVEETTAGYRAAQTSSVNALWLGLLRNAGGRPVEPPALVRAYSYTNSGGDDSDSPNYP